MSELAALIAQLTGQGQQPAQDPALAAVKLARASIDALVLKLGQTVDARVVGQLAVGLTQLSAGTESFVLKLETPLPQGTAVSIRVTQTPQGNPAVTVSVPNATPQVAQPMPVPTATAPLVEAQRAPPAAATPQPATPATSPSAPLPLPTVPSAPEPTNPAKAQPTALPASQPGSPPSATTSPAVAPTQPQPQAPPTVVTSAVPAPQPQTAPPSSQPVAQSIPTTTTQPSPAPGQPTAPSPLPVPGQSAAQMPLPVVTPTAAPAAASQLSSPVVQPQAAAPNAPAAPQSQPAAATPAPTAALPQPAATLVGSGQPAPSLVSPPVAQPPQPLPTHPSPYPVQVAPAATPAAQQPPLAMPAATNRPTAPPLNLSDPAQAASRQDSAAPLLARLATIVTATAPSLPRPVIEMALKLLANRVDLNRAAPDGKTLEAAVLKAGVLTPPSREPATDSKSALLALRSTLLAFLGGDATASIATTERPAPPIKGEPPRAPAPQPALADLPADGLDTARTLLGHTDAALSRLKLLQSASQPVADTRIDTPAPRNELRVEIPMLLGAETGILQLLVERDGKHKREPERQRGWRMRFAMNFSATGEVGADITLLGRAANIAIWAADPDTADALETLLPELAPAIQRHGLELTSLRVRRGAPQHARSAPGQLLDSAR